MKSLYSEKYFKTDNKLASISWLGLIPIVAVAFSCLAIFALGRFLPQKLPLFYSLPWGESQLATLPQFLIIPATLTALTLINLIIFWQLHNSQQLLKQILIYNTIIITFILMVALLKVILIFI